MAIVKGEIGNALTSVAKDHVVATTNDLYDEKLNMYQEDINDVMKNIDGTVAREETLVNGINKLSAENKAIKEDVAEMKSGVNKTAQQQTLVYFMNQTQVKLDEILEAVKSDKVEPISEDYIRSLFN